jgi:hypothetical protein
LEIALFCATIASATAEPCGFFMVYPALDKLPRNTIGRDERVIEKCAGNKSLLRLFFRKEDLS